VYYGLLIPAFRLYSSLIAVSCGPSTAEKKEKGMSTIFSSSALSHAASAVSSAVLLLLKLLILLLNRDL
jgi:hypothetical protein